MLITMRPTSVQTTLDGAPVRAWRGVTDAGTPCWVFVTRIAVPDLAKRHEFRELLDLDPPADPPPPEF